MSERATAPVELTLFSAPGCHLCEDAEGLLQQFEARGAVRVQHVNIRLDQALSTTYALRIPVLRAPSGQELNWPFDAAAIQALVRAP